MSGLKTAAWTVAAVTAVALMPSAGIIGGLLLGGAAVFSAAKAWGSHKESQREGALDAAHHAHAHFVAADRQRERAMAIEQSYGERGGPDTDWARQAGERAQEVAQGR